MSDGSFYQGGGRGEERIHVLLALAILPVDNIGNMMYMTCFIYFVMRMIRVRAEHELHPSDP